MFFVILEGLETDSAKSSLGFLDDLIEGHLLFFRVSSFFIYKKTKTKWIQFISLSRTVLPI